MGKEHIAFVHGDNHDTICTITKNNKTYTGSSHCHPSDYMYESCLVGENYAYTRALINELQQKRSQMREQLKIVNHILDIVEKNENSYSYAHNIIASTQKTLIRDIQENKSLIETLQNTMKADIKNRDILHEALNTMREKRKQENAGM